jgi:hypothetical protein
LSRDLTEPLASLNVSANWEKKRHTHFSTLYSCQINDHIYEN